MIRRNGMLPIALKLIAVAAATVFLFILVVNAMRNPVDAQTRGYSADFSDASGLRENERTSGGKGRGCRVEAVSQGCCGHG